MMAVMTTSPVLSASLLRTDGSRTTLQDELGSRALVVVFVRHYGCLLCRERVAQLRAHEAELAAAEAKVVFVGTGLPAMAAAFAAEWAGAHPVLSDPSRAVFAAAGMRRSLFATLHWRLFVNAWRAFRRGYRQGKVQGDPWQQGGVLVLDPRGGIVHRQVDRAGGDALDFAAVLAAVRSVAAPDGSATA